MAEVRAQSGVPVAAQFGGLGAPTLCAPLVVDTATGIIYSLKTGDVVVAAGGGITSLGTGVLTALGVNVGSAGAFVIFNGALGTPSSGTLTNATGLPEAGLTLADNTTNNSSTSKHGFLLKLSNTATQYMDGTGAWSTPAGASVAVDTRQVFLSGTSATYTTPSNVRQLLIRMKAGGGGSAGSGSTWPAGGVGGTTTFNSINAQGGGTNPGSSRNGSVGGTGGTGTASIRIAGAPGQPPAGIFTSATNAAGIGGNGGGTGAGLGGSQAAGVAGIANSGGGAGGAGVNDQAFLTFGTTIPSPGGGEGEYVEIIINSPASTYTYTVGAGGTAGTAGTGGYAGAVGGSGFIVVEERY